MYNECLSSSSNTNVSDQQGDNNTGPKLAYSLDLADKIDSRIKYALSSDHYLVMQSEKGTIYMFELDSKTPQIVEIDKVSEANFFFSNVSCFTLYKDETGMFATLIDSPPPPPQPSDNNTETAAPDALTALNDSQMDSFADANLRANAPGNPSTTSFLDMNVDDEEELLYGKAAESAETYINKLLTNKDLKASEIDALKTSSLTSAVETQQPDRIHPNQTIESDADESVKKAGESKMGAKKTTYWLLTVNTDGVLNLMWLDGSRFELVYSIPRFNQAPKTIIPVNNYKHVPFESHETVTGGAVARASSIVENANQVVIVNEILLVTLGFERNRPFLVVKMDEDLIV